MTFFCPMPGVIGILNMVPFMGHQLPNISTRGVSTGMMSILDPIKLNLEYDCHKGVTTN